MSTVTESLDVIDEHRSPDRLLSVVIPCLNEAENIELCVDLALSAIARAGIAGEVIVADNDSDDGRAVRARSSCISPRAAMAAPIWQGSRLRAVSTS
jgi:uncharacterized membrane-anchored protein